MKDSPISISPELAVIYDGTGQFKAFDSAFRKDPATFPATSQEPKKPR